MNAVSVSENALVPTYLTQSTMQNGSNFSESNWNNHWTTESGRYT
ncbi:hypothetical protein VD0002_g8564 [Verticillium dahliae]|uniref:Uncharacterized protein n=1 Tax=Verticillium dahliae TaxID=27337 RepID=A0AA44WRV6_VERDA|nr:hypothetical protein BJF96_g7 [Verticillium dahliae]PNH44039.1 hypothetical protein VD0003_g9511 [Verticillium dahliae]PNH58973.1 hypothetical protein VD0002_g8564 [Verticillium dahliae]